MQTIDEALDKLKASKFRTGFALKEKDKVYIRENGIDTIRRHAQDFVRERLAPAFIPNAGKQTPMHGYPVFLAQHACACCCRGCLNKWYHDQARARAIIKEEASLLNWTAFIYFQKGTTLIYAGQEVENSIRPDLFNRDPIDWNTGKDISSLIARLAEIKKNPLLTNSSYHLTAFDEKNVLLGTHTTGDRKMVGVFSFSRKCMDVAVELPDGVYQNMIDGSDAEVKNGKLRSKPSPIIIHN